MLLIVVPFFISKETQANLLKASKTSNKKNEFLYHICLLTAILFIDLFITSLRQIVSLKEEYTFQFSKVLMIGLYNSSTNCLFSELLPVSL